MQPKTKISANSARKVRDLNSRETQCAVGLVSNLSLEMSKVTTTLLFLKLVKMANYIFKKPKQKCLHHF